MVRSILIINGPNLGRLDLRDQSIYGAGGYAQLVEKINEFARELSIEVDIRQCNWVWNGREIKTNIDDFKKFFHFMLDGGVYLAPSAYEAGFTSIAHTNEVIDAIISAAEKSFQKLK